MPDDEDTFILPDAWPWHRLVLARHGDGRRRWPVAIDTEPEELLAEARNRLIAAAGHPDSEPELVAAARAVLADPEHPEPLGAALVTLHHGTRSVTGWIPKYGATFAARVALERLNEPAETNVHIQRGPRLPVEPVLRRQPTRLDTDGQSALLEPVRAALAALPDREYARAREALVVYRERGDLHRVVTSFLMPTEMDWVDADCAELSTGHGNLLWCAISTPDQRDARLVHGVNWWELSPETTCCTMVATLGAEAEPVLTTLLKRRDHKAPTRQLSSGLALMPTDTAFEFIRNHCAPEKLDEAAERFPVRAVRLLAESADKSLARHVLAHREAVEAARPALSEAARQRVDDVITASDRPPLAPPEALPPILVTPPWLDPKRPTKRVVLSLSAPSGPVVEDWPAELRERWLAGESFYHNRSWRHERDQVVHTGRLDGLNRWHLMALFVNADVATVRPFLEQWQPDLTRLDKDREGLRHIVARFGASAYPAALYCATSQATLLELVTPFVADEVPALMAGQLARTRSRPIAIRWLTRHPRFAASRLIPMALGGAGAERRSAEGALLLLDQRGLGEVVRTQAEQYGPESATAIGALLADQLSVLPKTVPELPDRLVPATLPPVLLHDGRALPDSAVRHLCTMLLLSKPGQPYAGIAIVKEACTSASLAAFGWALFERYGMLEHLGEIGDDSTALALAPIIRAWPGKNAHAKAVVGLDVLADIGTDTALGQLYAISQRVAYAGIKRKAREKVVEVAERLGLTSEQLADRLVPDLGLAADGSMVLDYGPRTFVVGFDEHLKPFVTDEEGKPRKTLPKPGVKDDERSATDAYQRFALVRKQVRTIATDQIVRLERAMVNRRRWNVDEFRRYLWDHPLMRHLARRLVWGAWTSDTLAATFRVAEDGTLAGPEDDEFVLPEGAVVGIPHPVELSDTFGAWGDLFADYHIAQPFEQLAREVHTPDADELARFAGTTVPSGRVLGMERNGWRRGDPDSDGIAVRIQRELPDGRYALVPLDPGIIVGLPNEWAEQKLGALYVAGNPRAHPAQADQLSTVDPITLSELVRDLSRMTAQ